MKIMSTNSIPVNDRRCFLFSILHEGIRLGDNCSSFTASSLSGFYLSGTKASREISMDEIFVALTFILFLSHFTLFGKNKEKIAEIISLFFQEL